MEEKNFPQLSKGSSKLVPSSVPLRRAGVPDGAVVQPGFRRLYRYRGLTWPWQ
jgi:hypothetical protein